MNFASITGNKAQDQPLRSVQLDGHVVLKIIKHCRESYPTLVTGQLLGLDIGQTLEVTDCYAFPVRSSTAACCQYHSQMLMLVADVVHLAENG